MKVSIADIGKTKITVEDKSFTTKKNGFASVPVLVDSNGQLLKAGIDYEKQFEYYYVNDTKLADGTTKTAGDKVVKMRLYQLILC